MEMLRKTMFSLLLLTLISSGFSTKAGLGTQKWYDTIVLMPCGGVISSEVGGAVSVGSGEVALDANSANQTAATQFAHYEGRFSDCEGWWGWCTSGIVEITDRRNPVRPCP